MIESGPGLAQPTSPSNMSCHGDSTCLSLASSHDILALQELTCFGCITRHPRPKGNFEDQTTRFGFVRTSNGLPRPPITGNTEYASKFTQMIHNGR
ncbi:uncharacterized protein RSE6_02660 [Rhynchosporium secalis]|uniref:Uncharacterized protein n=1 Tax=Rhynchosporium secalis TaxID=38038 RepID=A0A1E1M0R8_RHYSE|nr:uncharacterized protein RSE6_02660 [Rhynchosporium secalis]